MTITALLPLLATLAFAGSDHHHHELDKTTPGYRQFTKLSSVLGEWEGKGSDGTPVRLWYRLVSGGSTVLETQKIGDEPEMITVYHLDKEALVMTHYCSVNNQPHMRAAAPKDDIKQIEFAVERTSNLRDPDASRMTKLVLRFPDAGRLVQRWTWSEKGKETSVDFDLKRVTRSAAAEPKPVKPS